jgi:hypothetical protein
MSYCWRPPKSRTFHPVCSLFACRELGNILWRKVGLNERKCHMVPLTSQDGDDRRAFGFLPPDVAEHDLWGPLMAAAAQRTPTAVSLSHVSSCNR